MCPPRPTLPALRAKKSYGQHFLAQPAVARQIAYGVDLAGVDHVLEVGPGQGMLTQFLLERGVPLTAVEADADMVAHLRDVLPDWAPAHVVSADFLRVDLAALTRGRPTALVGNFPYNISSQILVRLVDDRALFPRMVGMFQRELAERVLSPPGSKTYGAISVLVQAYYAGTVMLHLKPGSFNPPPKVNSTVIALERLPPDRQPDADEATLRRVVRAAFNQRRKMLRNSLRALWPTLDPDDPNLQRRPEQLTVAEFAALARRVAAG